MSKTNEILNGVRDGRLNVSEAETMLREEIINDYEQSLEHARFTVEIISEADAPDGLSDPPVIQPALLRSIVNVHRNCDGEWCDDRGIAISHNLFWIGKQRLNAGLATWSSLSRDSVFGTRFEDVYIRVNVKASFTELAED